MLKAVKGDITKINDVDVIVNAANKTLLGGSGVDGAIHKAAGKKLLLECARLHGCKTGEAKITKAYNLPVAAIIHTVGPVWKNGNNEEEKMLAMCYYNSLLLAKENHYKRIAFPSISTGIYNYPVESAAKTAINTAIQFLNENPNSFELIEWVLFDDVTYLAYESVISECCN